jgi:glycosyltransferase involved in cell wall biosynthesis
LTATPRVIAYDLTRLFIGPLFATPRGIDRVDLALARRVFADPASDNLGILPTPWGVRAYPAWLVCKLLHKLESLWAEGETVERDAALGDLLERLAAPERPDARPHVPPGMTLGRGIRRIVDLLGVTSIRLGRPARSGVPQGAIYINVGQLGLAVPFFHNWLEERRDITSAMMLHDVIPLEYPHLVREGAVRHHDRMVRTVASHADCLIFNTAHARERVNEALGQHGLAQLPSLVRWLPLPDAFGAVEQSLPQLAGLNYFVVVSTVEPRKNHELLFRVWHRLAARLGRDAPHLVVVGAMGYRSGEIVDRIGHDPLVWSRIHFVSGLSSPALAALVLGATGMLSPSFAEGFGMPVLEASALGVPTLASDIAAHREIGGPGTRLLAEDDEEAWLAAICSLPPAGLRVRPQLARGQGEAAYCADLLAFLEQAATEKAQAAAGRGFTPRGSRPARR